MFTSAKIKSIGTSEGYFEDAFDRGDKNFIMSSTSLRAFLQCADRWIKGYTPPDSKAKLFGSLVDCLLMTPDEFKYRFPVKPRIYKNKEGDMVWSPTSTICKEWIASLEDDRMPITEEEFAEGQLAVKAIKGDEILAGWLESCETQVWIEAVWKDKTTDLEIPLRCLIDWLPRKDTIYRDCLGDLKCVRSGGPRAFKKQIAQMGWHLQAALYMDALNATFKSKESYRSVYCFTGVENFLPFQPFRYMLAQEAPESLEMIVIGRQMYQRALAKYAQCLATGKWPGYNDDKESMKTQGWSIIHADPYMAFDAQSDQMEFDQEQAMEDGESEYSKTTGDIAP